MKNFINRTQELKLLTPPHPLTVIFGRRRIGKTWLIKKWSKKNKLIYSQAIEGSESIQVEQLMQDFRPALPEGIIAHTFKEFLAILATLTAKTIFAIDEFPYLVKTNQSLPSMIQRWLDHKRPQNVSLVLLGSSQSMMHDLFLSSSSPLYERADILLHLKPMSYKYFCQAINTDPLDESSFLRYSIVGGVPKYWLWAEQTSSAIKLCNELFFEPSARLESEPMRLLKDEAIQGLQAQSILESIGRGSHRPSEIAARMGISQTALSKPLQILLNTSLIERALPFGESTRTTKRTLYDLADPALRFWYGVYSPHRSRWHLYTQIKQQKLIKEHASHILEKSFRHLYADSSRYWEQNIEFDSVRFNPEDETFTSIIVSEIKYRILNSRERQKLQIQVQKNFEKSKLAKTFTLASVEILDRKDILQKIST